MLDIRATKDRRIKTRGSARLVPLHPALVEAGFLEDVKALPQDGRLFPDLPKGPHGRYAAAWCRWFARWSGSLGHGLDSPQVTFHSLRHSFHMACRDAGVMEQVSDAFMGYSSPTIGDAMASHPL